MSRMNTILRLILKVQCVELRVVGVFCEQKCNIMFPIMFSLA